MMETTACITYAFRPSYQYHGNKKRLVPITNEIISEFIGFCKQKGTKPFVTKTVNDEAFRTLHLVVNRYFDRARIFVPTLRNNVYTQNLVRLKKLIDYTGSTEVNSDVNPIRQMYMSFATKPITRKKLEALQIKKHRDSLLPSYDDMKVLSEAVELNKKFDVYLISGDGDFLDFRDEIKQQFGVTAIDIIDLRNFASKIG